MKQLGRGVSETTIPNGEDVDAALLAKIRTEETPEVDAFEAQKVIEQLATCEVDDVVPAGDSFRVTLRVLGATTVHLLKMPSAKDVNRVPARLRARAGPAVQPPGTHHQHARGRRPLQEARRQPPKGTPETCRSSIRRSRSKPPSTLSTPPSQEDRDANF